MEYGIRGVFIQPFQGNGIFEGDNLQYDEEIKHLAGRLIDYYGESSIEGVLDLEEEVMAFAKRYDGTTSNISYKFVKIGHVWQGEFSHKGNFGGEALCEIFPKGTTPRLDWEDIVRNSRLSIGGTEEYAKGMTQRMIDEGLLEEIPDEKTGETLLKLTDNSLKYPLD